MIRISLPWIIETVTAIDALDEITESSQRTHVWGLAYAASSRLDALVSQSLYRDSLIACRSTAEKLKQHLGALISPPVEGEVGYIAAWNLSETKREFKTIFLAELSTLPSFFVTSKRPLDTETLLQTGEALMPLDLSSKVPEALYDIREAAQCLAFERSTAAAFHLFRALEAVVRAYHRVVCQGSAPPKHRNLGVYIAAISKANANAKVIAALTQIKDLHRNPVAHPEAVILPEEGITISGLVRSAISSMLAEIPVNPHTTLVTPEQLRSFSALETTIDKM